MELLQEFFVTKQVMAKNKDLETYRKGGLIVLDVIASTFVGISNNQSKKEDISFSLSILTQPAQQAEFKLNQI